jgi:F0F1-type ATP synthase membrane subunit b/b'
VEAAASTATEGAEAAASILPSQLNLNPIGQISPIVIVAVVVIITVMYFTLRKVYVLPYLGVLEERERLFETADIAYVEASQCVSEANADSERGIAEATAEAEAMRAEARESAEEYRRTRVTEAMRTAAARLEEGRAQIASAREAELSRLRVEAAECVHLACGQLVGSVDDDLVSATVERLMMRQAN